jgi:hypothetical protein
LNAKPGGILRFCHPKRRLSRIVESSAFSQKPLRLIASFGRAPP